MVSEDLLRAVLVANGRLRDAGEALIAAANEAGGRDNITVVLVRLEEVTPGGPAGDQATLTGAIADPGASATEPDADPDPKPSAVAPDPDPGAQPSPTGAEGDTGPSAAVAVARRPAPVSDAPVQQRRPRRGPARGDGAASSRARMRRRLRRARTVTIAVVVLALIGSAAYLAIQSIYFIGTNSRGLVTIYNGLPLRLPAGIALYTTTYVSGVSAATIPPARRRSLLDHSLRSESNAASLIRSLELGQLE
jgi:protein phosphatase